MIKIVKNLIVVTGLISSYVAFAAQPAAIDLQIDSDFKNQNIIFVTEEYFGHQNVGIHQSGGSLMTHTEINPIQIGEKYPEVQIFAYVTDPSLGNRTQIFVTQKGYQFKPNEHIALNFPVMFKKI